MATTLEGGRRQTGDKSRTATTTGTDDKGLSHSHSYKVAVPQPLGPLITGEPALGDKITAKHADTCSCIKCPWRTMNGDPYLEV